MMRSPSSTRSHHASGVLAALPEARSDNNLDMAEVEAMLAATSPPREVAVEAAPPKEEVADEVADEVAVEAAPPKEDIIMPDE
jgi:hypothetical protein